LPFMPDSAGSLPEDGFAGTLVGRIWRPDQDGPSVVVARDGTLFDISQAAATVSALCEAEAPAALARSASGDPIGSVAEVLANTPRASRDAARPWLLAPVDLQVIKASGVTFAVSMLERVVEEQALGAPEKAADLRDAIRTTVGEDLAQLKPGSEQAMALKQVLIEKGVWSQYFEVGIGPDAEIFTKAPVLSAVGTGFEIGIHPGSSWNNPERPCCTDPVRLAGWPTKAGWDRRPVLPLTRMFPCRSKPTKTAVPYSQAAAPGYELGRV
jgi:fumarylacetoacetate (FAA) hydrolase family protein